MEGGMLVIQKLLRPTDTCVFVVQGYLLGPPSPAQRLCAVVKHEGSEEHALFLFEVDLLEAPPRISVDKFFAIRGSFSAKMQAVRSAQCTVLVDNGEGSSLVLQLPYETHTALFISQISKALHQFAYSQSAESPTAFAWLQGYEACCTGWERFTKPGHAPRPRGTSPTPLIDFGRGGSPGRSESLRSLREAFPERWPWSHIITPNSDGTTEFAPCESLLEAFDPLFQKEPETSEPPEEVTNQTVDVSVTRATPDHSPIQRRSSNPFIADEHSFPFPSSTSPTLSDPGPSDSPDIRHCISDSNLLQLENEIRHRSFQRMEPLVSRSEQDLAIVDMAIEEERHCVAVDWGHELTERDDSDYCIISIGGSPSSDPPLAEERGNSGSPEEERNHLTNKHLERVLDRPHASTFSSDSGDEDALDYRARRSRSNEGSPVLDQQKITDMFFKRRLDFLVPSGSKPGVSKVNMNSPELTSRKKGRGRSGSKPASVTRSVWVSRYRPGVPVPMQSARESIVQAELRTREKEFTLTTQLRVFCGTWNVNGKNPPSSLDQFLLEYKGKDEEEATPPDVYAIALQEMDLSAQCLMSNESNREEPWVDTVELTLRKAGNYQKLCLIRCVGIMLMVYIRKELQESVSDVETEMVLTGMHGLLGNKGGVAAHFNLHHSSLCFVNTHLPANMEEVDKRNEDFHVIMNKLVFSKVADYVYGIMDHDMVFWLGDLNYRIQTTPEMSCDMIKAHADNYQINTLLKFDQLVQEMARRNVFVGFTEYPVDFKPTYKYDPNTDNWDTSEKHRPPAWCDRILYHGKGLVVRGYVSHPKMKISDHKPVSALLDATIRVVIPDKEREVLEQITWKLDKLENDTLPQVDLSVREFHFKDVKFLVPQSKRLVVTNTGQRPVHVSFIPKLDDKAYSKPWLEVKPPSAVIQPLEDVVLVVTVEVDEDTAPALNTGKDKLEDILVLHLEKGKDFFISVSGNYLHSVFGSSLDTLVHLHTYIREVPVAQLIDLTTSWDTSMTASFAPSSKEAPPPLDIPKELFQLVDFISRHGLLSENLFTDGGRATELVEIRDMLDVGGRELPGSIHSVAAALLMFLASLAEPVVPSILHQRCMDCCNNATLCKQMLMQMPLVHRRSFVFLVTLMKKLLKHTDANGLEPKVLATIFGEVMLKPSAEERRAKSKRQLSAMNRKKATFIYQFLVNDLTIMYT